MTDHPPQMPVRRWRRTGRWGLTICIVAGVLYLMRGTLLQAVAAPLIVSQSTKSATGLLLVGGERKFSAAAEFMEANPSGDILLLKQPESRLERLEILPSQAIQARDDLVRRGINVDRITILDPSATNESPGQVLGRWMQQHQNAHLLVACDLFLSREVRWQLDAELPRECSQRLSVAPPPIRSYDRTRWWKYERGILQVARGWLGLAQHVIYRGRQVEWYECDPEAFQPAKT